jgi:hypothetical protein
MTGPTRAALWSAAALLSFSFLFATTAPAALILETPYNLTCPSFTSTTIDLRWAGSGPTFRVLYSSTAIPTGPTDPAASSIDTSNTSVTISGLTPSTAYVIVIYAHRITAIETFSPGFAKIFVVTAHGTRLNYFVDSQAGSDANSGAGDAPWKTITHAMTVALPGDTINVRRGRYTLATGEIFPIAWKSGVKLVSTSGAAVTILDAAGANTLVTGCGSLSGVTASNTVFEGFTVTGAMETFDGRFIGSLGGGGIVVGFGCYAQVLRNIVVRNQAIGGDGTGSAVGGGGIFVVNGGPRIENNVIANNVARGGKGADAGTPENSGSQGLPGGDGRGGGIWLENADDAVVVNNTIYGNVAFGGAGGNSLPGQTGGAGGSAYGGGIGGTTYRAINNIIVSNQTVAAPGGGPAATMGPAGTNINGGLDPATTNFPPYANLFWHNQPNDSTDPGLTAVFADPLFFNAAKSDFHVAMISPARHAGADPVRGVASAAFNPVIDLENVIRPTPPTIGALERPPRDRVEFHGDFDGDGRDEVLLRHLTTGDIGMWMVNGGAVVGGAFVGNVPTTLDLAGIADFNGDGRADILFRDSLTGDIGVWLMNGSSIIAGGYLGAVDPSVEIAGFGDFNGDGRADILFLHQTSGTVAMWFMNGPSIIGGGSVTTGDPLLYVAGVGDFNSDGKDDILWRQHASGEVAIWLMNGLNIIGGGLVGAAPQLLSIAGVADFDGDGKADVLWRHTTTGDVGLWFISGTKSVGGGLAGSAPLVYAVASVGDYDGNGTADVLWNYAAVGDVGIWRMSGATVLGGSYVGNALNFEVH